MLNYRYLSTSTEIETYSSHFVESLTTIINKRLLLEDSSDSSMEEPTINTFSEKVLIAVVIAVPCLLIFLFCVICCVYPGLSDQCYNGRERSDREYGDAVVRRHAEEEEKNKENPQERRNRIVNHVASNRVTMTVTKECFLANPQETGLVFEGSDEEMQIETDMQIAQDCEEVDTCIAESLFIPKSTQDEEGKVVEPLQNGGRKVANCCAICLCKYEINEKIVWSNYKACKHAFHESCILEYLQNQKGTPCPCCRHPFVDLLENVKAGKDSESASIRRYLPVS